MPGLPANKSQVTGYLETTSRLIPLPPFPETDRLARRCSEPRLPIIAEIGACESQARFGVKLAKVGFDILP